MRWLMGVLIWGCCEAVWAAYQTTPTQMDATSLMNELQAAVPETGLCENDHGTIICRRKTGEFDAAERALLDAAVLGHDPNGLAKRTQRRQQDRATGAAKLRALGLSTDEINALTGDR